MNVWMTAVTSRFRLTYRAYKGARMMGFMYRVGLKIKNFGEIVKMSFIRRMGIALMDEALNMKVK